MPPLTILAAQKLSELLINQNALEQQISTIAAASNVILPTISPEQVVLSSVSADMADKDLQFTYPRISVYSVGVKNMQLEKFRSLSGTVSVTAELWASANLLQQTDQWIHFYVEAMTNILRENIGDWGDGIFFSGSYDVQLQSPKVGGIGYVESAKVIAALNVSRT